MHASVCDRDHKQAHCSRDAEKTELTGLQIKLCNQWTQRTDICSAARFSN